MIADYETNSKNRRKERSNPYKSTTSRGKPPIHYINEQFFDDTNEKTSLYILESMGSQYNPSRPNNNNVRAQ